MEGEIKELSKSENSIGVRKIFSKVLVLFYDAFGESDMFPFTMYMWWFLGREKFKWLLDVFFSLFLDFSLPLTPPTL